MYYGAIADMFVKVCISHAKGRVSYDAAHNMSYLNNAQMIKYCF